MSQAIERPVARLTRKEIAFMINATVWVVRSNEKRWGLDAHKVAMNARNISYVRGPTIELLRGLGLMK